MLATVNDVVAVDNAFDDAFAGAVARGVLPTTGMSAERVGVVLLDAVIPAVTLVATPAVTLAPL